MRKLKWRSHGHVAFIDPRGTTHVGGEKARPPKLPKGRAEALVRRNRQNDVAPDAYTATPRPPAWKSERDIPDAMLFRATEAGLAQGCRRRRSARHSAETSAGGPRGDTVRKGRS